MSAREALHPDRYCWWPGAARCFEGVEKFSVVKTLQAIQDAKREDLRSHARAWYRRSGSGTAGFALESRAEPW